MIILILFTLMLFTSIYGTFNMLMQLYWNPSDGAESAEELLED
jgi:hypothetical protein